jgi:hypothetical protein
MSDYQVHIIAAIILITCVLVMAWAPGHIARSRGHRSAQAIALCGWLSLFLWPLWLVAVIWAHTGDTIPKAGTRPAAKRSKHRMSREQWEAVDALENMR